MTVVKGRPRDTTVDAAIADATRAVLLSDGYAAVNIDRIAKLAGTTRATVYRRAKTRDELVTGLLISRFGLAPAPDIGDLRRDLLELQRMQRDFFIDPIVRAALAGLLSDMASPHDANSPLYQRFLQPRRQSVATMLERAASRGEIALIDNPEIVSDLLTGPLLLRAVLPAIGPIEDAVLHATVDAALAVCGMPP